MKKVLLFSFLLCAGLVWSQLAPYVAGGWYEPLTGAARMLTMVGLAYIMIHVGFEFDIDKKNIRQYGWDYIVAATAATFPWIFCAVYFVMVLLPLSFWTHRNVWEETLLVSRFAAPTSAGVLFSMLAAAGLGASWLFRKARILAIFDDVDTVLLLIPLQIMIIGFRWELMVTVGAMLAMLWIGWRYLNQLNWPLTYPWVLGYSIAIVGLSEGIYRVSKGMNSQVGIHLEVLLPAFVLGCVISIYQERHDHEPREKLATTIVSSCFMFLVGMSMPVFIGPAVAATTGILAKLVAPMSWGTIVMHVAAITVISNVGKMFCAFCYRAEATWRERLALSIGMWPRGEVGAGVLVLSLSYGIGGPVMIVAMLSLAVNLLLTGFFIATIKWLLTSAEQQPLKSEKYTLGMPTAEMKPDEAT